MKPLNKEKCHAFGMISLIAMIQAINKIAKKKSGKRGNCTIDLIGGAKNVKIG